MKLGTLRIKMPDGQAREFAVEQPVIGAGRASDNELVVDDISVSRRHAQLTFDAGQMLVEDLASGNGTYLGSQRIAPNTPTPVPPDQAVRLGDVELRFVPVEAPKLVRPPARESIGAQAGTMIMAGPSGSAAPNVYGLLRVKTPDGKSREFGLDQPTITIGRSSDNQLTLDENSVSRRHARLTVESGRLMIEDLGSANGTYIGSQRLAPQNPGLVSEDQVVRVGDVEIRYVPPRPVQAASSFAASNLAASAGGGPAASQPEAAGPPVNISLLGPAQPVAPGMITTASLTIQNRGTVVDEFTVRVSGMPANWVRLGKERVPLLPNAQEQVTITFAPPRRSEAVATDHRFTVSVISREHHTGVNAQGVLKVLPYLGFAMHLDPVRSRRNFQLVAENEGNSPVTYRLSGTDDEHSLLFNFSQDRFSLQPGQTLALPLQVIPKVKPTIGASQTRAFNVVAESADQPDAAEVRAPGQLIIRPPIPIWLIPLVLLVSLCFCLVAAYSYVTFCPTDFPNGPFCPAAAKPVINVFTVTPAQVSKGGSVVIAWDVSNAEKVELVVPEQNTLKASGLQTFKIDANTTFTLRATNFAGSVEQSINVIVSQSPPVIQSFTANPGVITAGQTDKIALSWTVLGATSVSIQGVSGPFAPTTGSVVVPAPITNTTYTLVATNDAGPVHADVTVVISSAKCSVANLANGDKLNLREGPGAGYASVILLDNGTPLDPIGRNATGDWIKVDAAGREGWVSTAFVSCSNVPDLSVYPTVAPNLIPTLAPTPTPTSIPASATPTLTPTPKPTATDTPTATPVLSSGGLVTYKVQQGGHTSIFLQPPTGAPIALLSGKDDAEVLAYTSANGGRFAIWALEGAAQKLYIVSQAGSAVGNPITGSWDAINDADWSNDGKTLVVETITGATVKYYYYDANGNLLAQPVFP